MAKKRSLIHEINTSYQMPGLEVHAYNSSTGESEAEGWEVPGQPGLRVKTSKTK
jgi:hypothetical protein